MLGRKIITKIDELAPLELTDKWDNSGLQIGDINTYIKGILLVMDISTEVIDKALSKGCNMIISHHPLFFEEIKKLDFSTKKGKMIETIIKNDILVYSVHSNIDRAPKGMNDMIKKKLKIQDSEVLLQGIENEFTGYGIIGKIIEIKNIGDLSNYLKEKLNIENLRIYGDLYKNLNKIAFCGGSGSFLIEDAISKNADVIITGDIKHHDVQKALERDLLIIDIGHFKSEFFILDHIKEYLTNNLEEDISIFIDEEDYFSYTLI